MKRTMITLISVAVLMSVTAGTGSAATIWRGGDIACSYAQFPIGSFAGAFISTGTMITEEGQFLPSGSAAAAAGVAGGWSLGLFGITQGEVPGEVDLIVLVVNSDTGIPEPGTWTGSLADDTVFAMEDISEGEMDAQFADIVAAMRQEAEMEASSTADSRISDLARQIEEEMRKEVK